MEVYGVKTPLSKGFFIVLIRPKSPVPVFHPSPSEKEAQPPLNEKRGVVPFFLSLELRPLQDGERFLKFSR